MNRLFTISILIVLISILTACESEENVELRHQVGKKRHELFIECMNLAGKIRRESDDDVNKIVKACDQVAYYMANHMAD